MPFDRTMRCILSLVLLAALPLAARGDRVVLKSGGQIEGRVLEDESRDDHYVIETSYGGRFIIERFDVDHIEEQGDLEREYQERARKAPDTVASHWQLAQWCRENKLNDASERHLERILELEPQHVEARSLLGFRSVQGQWLTRDQLMAARGMKWFRGKYRSQQEIELLERHEEAQATAGQWRARIARWRRQLSDRDPQRVHEAQESIAAITDPAAADALVDMLAKEENFAIKKLLLEVLAGIDHPSTLDSLVNHALLDPSEEIRAESLDLLIRSQRPGVASSFIRALRHRDNVIVNRAADALREIGDPVAIKPLVEALVTQHTFVGGGPPGQQSYTMNSSGVMSFGGGGPKVERRKLNNPAVLSALVALTGGTSFEYDQPRWRQWLATQRQAQEIDMRRDE